MERLTAAQAYERLEQGNRRFLDDTAEGAGRDEARRKMLAKSQSPFAIILCCADSRVVPEIAFDTGLGELFVVRVAGNVANRATIASIEYAVSVMFPIGLAGDVGYRAIPYSFLLGAIFLLVFVTGQALLDPFEGLPSDTPMSSIIRTIEINLLEQIGAADIPAPVEPVDGSYLL